MFNTKGLMSSNSDEWRTPQEIFNRLDREFNFDSDPCPMVDKPLKQGLRDVMGNRVFINPPYSRIAQWVQGGYDHSQNLCCLVVMLIPSRTDTRWWHKYVMKAEEIRLIKGRLKFNDHKGSAPFPSCIVIFKGKKEVAIPPTLKSVGILANDL